MIEVKGNSGIVAKILADSVNQQGNRLVTYELTYPRIIHSELLTHKMLCSNSASSRAIPFNKMAEQLTARPVRFGQANKGMQDTGENFHAPVEGSWGESKVSPNIAWEDYCDQALRAAKAFYDAGYHKQVYNRLTEPFQMMKTVISGTEWNNFFWLRLDSATDPTLYELARCMQEAIGESLPRFLKAGQYHLPYVELSIEGNSHGYFIEDTDKPEGVFEKRWMEIGLKEAIKVSCARTAAVSFRNEDYGLQKCLEVYARLINSDRVHASATQHAATPMETFTYGPLESQSWGVNHPHGPSTWEPGVSHSDRQGQLWSAQYRGWIMHRKLIPNENYTVK